MVEMVDCWMSMTDATAASTYANVLDIVKGNSSSVTISIFTSSTKWKMDKRSHWCCWRLRLRRSRCSRCSCRCRCRCRCRWRFCLSTQHFLSHNKPTRLPICPFSTWTHLYPHQHRRQFLISIIWTTHSETQ